MAKFTFNVTVTFLDVAVEADTPEEAEGIISGSMTVFDMIDYAMRGTTDPLISEVK